MYRTLLATCGSASFSSLYLLYMVYTHLSFEEPHVASNVRYIAFQWERTPYSHLASKVRYFHVTPLNFNEYKHLTHTLPNNVRYISRRWASMRRHYIYTCARGGPSEKRKILPFLPVSLVKNACHPKKSQKNAGFLLKNRWLYCSE